MELAAMMCLSEPLRGKNKYPKQPLLDHLIIEIRTKQDRKGLFTFTKKFMENIVGTIPVENFSKRSTNFSTLGGLLQQV